MARMIAGFGTLPKAPPVTVVVQASPAQGAARHEGGKGLARERWAPPVDALPAEQQAVVLNARSMAEAESNDSCVPFDQAEALEQMFGPETVQPPPPVAPSGPVAMVLPRPASINLGSRETLNPVNLVMLGSDTVRKSEEIPPLVSAPPAAPAPTRKRAPRAKAASVKPRGSETKVEPTREQRVAEALGVDLATACPVCEAVDPCACSEEERTFARRTRRGFAGVLRCSLLTCRAPLSVLYLPRVGAPEKDRGLVHYTAVHLCAACQGDGIAAILGAP